MLTKPITDITKEYTKFYKVVVYKQAFRPDQVSHEKKQNNSDEQTETSIERSVRRTRTMINDYVYCNKFDMFATFTFDPKKVDRYDDLAVENKMKNWLQYMTKKYSNFGYIIVPERHKDGAIHFHALIQGYAGDLIKSRAIQHGKRVYNLVDWNLGWTNITYLDEDQAKTVAYLCKYITKDMSVLKNKRRYWSSRSLTKPAIYHNAIYDKDLATRIDPSTMVYESSYNVIYHIKKTA